MSCPYISVKMFSCRAFKMKYGLEYVNRKAIPVTLAVDRCKTVVNLHYCPLRWMSEGKSWWSRRSIQDAVSYPLWLYLTSGFAFKTCRSCCSKLGDHNKVTRVCILRHHCLIRHSKFQGEQKASTFPCCLLLPVAVGCLTGYCSAKGAKSISVLWSRCIGWITLNCSTQPAVKDSTHSHLQAGRFNARAVIDANGIRDHRTTSAVHFVAP
jgi:hypothetical protein